MNLIIDDAQTILEKRKYYNDDSKIDYSYVEEWREVRSLLNEDIFKVMLQEEGMTYSEFAYSVQDLEAIEEPQWHLIFLNIINQFDYNMIDYAAGINVLTLPFSKYLLVSIRDKVKNLKHLTISDKVYYQIIEYHNAEMFNLIGKVMALKLAEYKLKVSDNKKLGAFQNFLKDTFYSKESFISFFEEYPVIARLLVMRTEFLKDYILDLLTNIDNDVMELKIKLNLSKNLLTGVELSAGDSHEQGKFVTILEFNHTKKIVYKPKDLKIEEQLSDLLRWCCENGLLDIKLPKGVYKKGYTYNEFIEFKPCNTKKDVNNFYTRYGYLIAFCLLLGIDDLHLENIIACGDQPVVVDIETAFQCPPEIAPKNIYNHILSKLERESVRASCLLPTKINVGVNGSVELSALTGREAELDNTVPVPKNIGTDNFCYEDKKIYFEGGKNIPVFQGKEVDYKKYRLRILEGFEEFIYSIMNNKSEFIKKVEAMKGTKIRVLLKGTEKYASMLRYSTHPNYNTKMKYRERLFMNIWAYPYVDKRVVKSEIQDLICGDIPVFYSYVGTTNIIDSRGNVYNNYFRENSLNKYINFIRNLSDDDINEQRQILLVSLGLIDDYNKLIKNDNELIPLTLDIEYLREAETIAKDLIDSTISYDGNYSMVNIDCDKSGNFKLIPADESFYSGLSGIAVFFLELYIKTKKTEYYKYYQRYIRTAILQTHNTMFESPFVGWLSPMYALVFEYCHLSTMTDYEYFDFTIEKLNSLSTEDIERIKRLDYISGISGIICLIHKINTIFPNKISDDVVEKAYSYLYNNMNDGSVEKPGIAHGISGVVLALLRDNDEEKVRKLLNKEQRTTCSHRNAYKWCLGLSGMIQARLVIYKFNPSLIAQNELYYLFNQFEELLFKLKINNSLCHGNSGIAVTLKLIYDFTKDEKWNILLKKWISNFKLKYLFESQLCKPNLLCSKGLFDGLTGIGWMFLFLEGNTPNILTLDFY